MGVNQAYNFKRINDLVSTAGVLTEEQLKLLKLEGYEAVVNLLPDENEHAIKNEASLVTGQGLIYAHIAVDFTAPGVKDYQAFELKFKELSGKKVMLHCAANYRASAFYAIFACAHLGWSAEEALAHISSIWKLSDYPVWEEFVNNMLSIGSVSIDKD